MSILQEIEKNLKSINGVSNCRVIGDDQTIDEIHIINQTSRSPKQIARDVESYIKTAFKINLNHKKISIVNLDIPMDTEDENEAFEFGKRIAFENLSITQGGRQAVIELELGFDGKMYKRQETSINIPDLRYNEIGKLTLGLAQEICEDQLIFALNSIRVDQIAGNDIVLALVTIISNGEARINVGSAIIRDDVHSAIVKAVLDSINRIVSFLQPIN